MKTKVSPALNDQIVAAGFAANMNLGESMAQAVVGRLSEKVGMTPDQKAQAVDTILRHGELIGTLVASGGDKPARTAVCLRFVLVQDVYEALPDVLRVGFDEVGQLLTTATQAAQAPIEVPFCLVPDGQSDDQTAKTVEETRQEALEARQRADLLDRIVSAATKQVPSYVDESDVCREEARAPGSAHRPPDREA